MKMYGVRKTLSVGICCLAGAAAQGGELELRDWHGSDGCLHHRLEALELIQGTLTADAFDEETGRDLRNFPPDRLVDYLHMKLDMRFENLNDRSFTATETLRFTPIGRPTESLTLNAIGLQIEQVTIGGGKVEFYRDDETLTLNFEPPLAVGQLYEVEMRYTCTEPYAGMTFTPFSEAASDYTAEVHTQGQPETNRHWFIAHDAPNERMTTELIVDVPEELQVSGNGKLVSNTVEDGRRVWHYLQDKPHVSYLVSLVIGKFDIVEIPHDRVPMKVWAPVGMGDRVMQTYGRTGQMIDMFERHFGVPYPWARYDQLIVKNFGAGGMENTSATSMYPTAILDETELLDTDLDGLIAHELAHQWTGDLITCKSWEHIWLNEGWATYGANLWFEQRDGEDGYLDAVRRSARSAARRDRTTNDLPMVSPIYEHPWETFRRAANPYPKGASILHMLRQMLGDELFFKGVHLYMNRHQSGVVETNDFRYALEEVSGLGLEWFFDQWCYRPGVPHVTVDVRYDATDHELILLVEQTQEIDARTPAFRFTLPIYVATSAGPVEFSVDVREKSTTHTITLDAHPSFIAIDPYLAVLKQITVNKPQQMWLMQAQHGPTIIAKHEAISALAQIDTPQVVHLLDPIIRDESIRYTLRNTAVRSLAELGSRDASDALLAIAKDGIEEARVRSTVVGALDDIDSEEVPQLLAEFATTDASYDAREAAIRGLAELEAKEHADAIVELVHFPSQHENVRTAALRALRDLEDERCLELAMQYAAYGITDRARASAVEIIGEVAEQDEVVEEDEDAAVEFLLPLLHDPERRTVRAAGAALAAIGDERALEPLEAIASSHPDERMRDDAKEWVETLKKNMKEKEESKEGDQGGGVESEN